MIIWNRDDPLEPATSEKGQIENKRANQALRDYAYLGTSRSFEKLRGHYTGGAPGTLRPCPTKSSNTMKKWSLAFAWVERVNRWDELERARAQANYEARRAEIMQTGLALDYERVVKLKRVCEQLDGYLAQSEKVWLPDVKSIRVGSSLEATPDGKTREIGEYERVELVHFNSALFSQLLAALEALAAETGGRIKRSELTGKDGGPLSLTEISADEMAKARKAAQAFEQGLINDAG